MTAVLGGGGPAAAPRSAFVHVVAALVGLHACMAATRVAASLAVLQQGYADWVVGLLLSLYAVAPIVLSLWAGRLADRFGFHRPVSWAVAMALLGAAMPVLTQHIAAIAFSGLLTGGAVSVAAVAIQREAGLMARDPDDLKRVFSWVSLGPALSNMGAPVLTGLVIDHLGFRAAFAFGALLPLWALWSAWRVPRQPTLPGAGTSPRAAGRALELLRMPVLRNVLLVNIAMAAAWDAHSFTVPVVGHARALSASAIGLVLGSFALAATIVRLALSTFARHVDEPRVLRVAITLATAVLAVYAWLPGAWGMMLGSALLGVALGSVQPMVLSMLHQAAPADRQGQVLALRMLFTNAATISMPAGFGLLAAVTSTAAPMWAMAGLLLLARWPVSRLRLR
ncbi:MAG TPA: MFS transporter [Burkholderiaceae bacterium]|nr:MFS transporter [Burkholderiaceae bacterium]